MDPGMKRKFMNTKMILPWMALALLGLAGCGGSAPTAHEQDVTPEDAATYKKIQQMEQRTSCPPEPGWVLGKGHPKFTDAQYLIGVGISAESPGAAKDTATAELAKNIKVHVQSVMKDFASTSGIYAEQTVKTVVNAAVEGVERKDGYFDKCRNQYYALVVLNRKLEASKIQKRIGETESLLKQHLSAGESAENQGDLVKALSQYHEGKQLAPTLGPLSSTLAVFTRSTQGLEPSVDTTPGAFSYRIKSLVQSVRFDAVSGDKQGIKSFQLPDQPFVVKAYLSKDSGEVPLQNIPVFFKYDKGTGELQSAQNTGSNGEVKATVVKIHNYDHDQHRVMAKLDLDQLTSGLPPNLVSLLEPLGSRQSSFHYSIEKIEGFSAKSHVWRTGLVHLVERVLTNIKPGTSPTIGVIQFQDARYKKVTSFTEILVEDLKGILAQADNLSLKEIQLDPKQEINPGEIAKANGLDMYVNGSYRMEPGGLQIIAKLIKAETNTYLGSGSMLIHRRAISPEDLKLLEKSPSGSYAGTQSMDEDFRQELDKLVYARPGNQTFKVKVWTNKQEYQVGDNVVFYAKADRDSYLTLFDIATGGDVTVIFPNAFHKDNFIKAGVTYKIPAPSYGFQFDIQGPSGLERVKAIATATPQLPIDLNLEKGFHTFKPGTARGMRDISVIAKQFTKDTNREWAESHTEIFIFNRDDSYNRGIRKIPIKEKPEKPIDMIGTFGREPGRR